MQSARYANKVSPLDGATTYAENIICSSETNFYDYYPDCKIKYET